MIIEITEQSFDEVINFCWNIAQDKTQYGFPRFDNYQHLSQRFLDSLHHPDDKILVYYENGILVGVLNLFVETKENYLHAVGGVFTTENFNTITDLFIQYLQIHYPGYDFQIGFPVEHVAANNYFKNLNAPLLDASLTMKLVPLDFISHPDTHTLIKVTEHNFDKYATFHDKYFGSFYWNSTRLSKKMEQWYLFYLEQNDIIIGSIFIRQHNPWQLEVFGLILEEAYHSEDAELNLLSQALTQTLTDETQEVTFFVDEDNESHFKTCLKNGFKQFDTYRSYKITL